jgi:hypothetical protein
MIRVLRGVAEFTKTTLIGGVLIVLPIYVPASEVESETRRTLGFSRTVGVKRCRVFEGPDKVECGRHCLEARFPRQWPYADRRRRGLPG